MDPNGQPPDPNDDPGQQRIDRATDDLSAKLSEPLPPSPIPAPPSSIPSEMEALTGLVSTVVLRVEQLAKTMAEAYSRLSQLAEQQIATMRLMQEMIARSDELQAIQGQQIDDQGTQTAALVKINANLSEIVAALTGQDQKG